MFLEHANLNVESIDECLRFLMTAFPDIKVRGRGDANGRPWLHVGTDDTYLALNETNSGLSGQGTLNHLGFVVEDVESVADRLTAAGYREGFAPPSHPHRKRRYFLDSHDLEWEFVEYLADDPNKRNDYSI